VILLIGSLGLVLVEQLPFADEALDMFPASVDHIGELVTEYVFG